MRTNSSIGAIKAGNRQSILRSSLHRRRQRTDDETQILNWNARDLTRDDGGAAANRQRHLRARTRELHGDVAGRIPHPNDDDTLPGEWLRPAVVHAVHHLPAVRAPLRKLRLVRIRDNAGRDHQRARVNHLLPVRRHEPLVVHAINSDHARLRFDR